MVISDFSSTGFEMPDLFVDLKQSGRAHCPASLQSLGRSKQPPRYRIDPLFDGRIFNIFTDFPFISLAKGCEWHQKA